MNLREILNAIRPYVQGWTFQDGIWTPTFTGFSADPAGVIALYALWGNRCRVDVVMPNAGTSNATDFTVSAPFPAAVVSGMSWGGVWWTAQDNGAFLTAPGRVYISSGGSVFALLKDTVNAAWTASGAKKAYFGLEYQIN